MGSEMCIRDRSPDGSQPYSTDRHTRSTSGVWSPVVLESRCTSATRRRFPFQLGRPGQGRMPVDQFRLIQSHNGFHQRVVQGVADAVDRLGDPGLALALGNAIDVYWNSPRPSDALTLTRCSELEFSVARENRACLSTDVTSAQVLLVISCRPRIPRGDTPIYAVSTLCGVTHTWIGHPPLIRTVGAVHGRLSYSRLRQPICPSARSTLPPSVSAARRA